MGAAFPASERASRLVGNAGWMGLCLLNLVLV